MNDLTRTQLFPILLELITNVSASSTRLWTSFRILASLLSPTQCSTHSKYSMTVIKNPHENDVFAIRQKNRKASTEAPDGMYSTSLAIREHVFVLALGFHPSCPMSLLYRGFPRWGCWITWGKFGSFLDSQFNFLLIMTFLDTGFFFFFFGNWFLKEEHCGQGLESKKSCFALGSLLFCECEPGLGEPHPQTACF